MTHHFSDETLNAFIDNELEHDERQRIVSALSSNADLYRRLNDLRAIRDMVQLAYPEPKTPSAHSNLRSGSLRALAASLLLAIGMVIGWSLHTTTGADKRTIGDIARAINESPANSATRVVLHITTNNPEKLAVVLDETEFLLKKYALDPEKLKIAILANGKGLQLLRANNSPFRQRLVSLRKQHPNLILMACNKTLQRLQSKQGIRVKLLPDTEIVPSAMREVISRQQAGWTHIQI